MYPGIVPRSPSLVRCGLHNPQYPGTVPGCPYGGDSIIPRHYPGMSLWWGLHKYPRYPRTVTGCPYGGDSMVGILSIPGIPGLSRDVPMVGAPQSPDTKYPRYPGTVPGCPYGGDSIIPRHYKYPRYPGMSLWWGLHNSQILSIPGIPGLSRDVPIVETQQSPDTKYPRTVPMVGTPQSPDTKYSMYPGTDPGCSHSQSSTLCIVL